MLNKRVGQAPLGVRPAPAVVVMRAAVVATVTVIFTGGTSQKLALDSSGSRSLLAFICLYNRAHLFLV